MAIAPDTVVNGGNNGGTTNSLTWSHTCAGSNRRIEVGIVGDAASGGHDDITGVTYGGVALTLIGKNVNTNLNRMMYVYALLGPATGSHSVVVSCTNNHLLCGASVSFTGALQTALTDNTGITTTALAAHTMACTLTSVADNCWMLVFAHSSGSVGQPTAGAGTTQRTPAFSFSIGAFLDSNGAVHPAGPTTLNVNWTGNSAAIGGIAYTIAPAATVANGVGSGAAAFSGGPDTATVKVRTAASGGVAFGGAGAAKGTVAASAHGVITVNGSAGGTVEDAALNPYTLEMLEPGVSPRVVRDFETLCFPGPWVQLFYGQTGAGTVRRDEDERFRTVHNTTLTDNNVHRRLEEAFRTTDRRLTVLHSIHDPVHGTYALQRLNTGKYTDKIPRPLRPNFVPNVGNVSDLYWLGGFFWRNPMNATPTNSLQLTVRASEAVTAMQVAALNSYPGGYRPVFDQQVQEYAPGGGIASGGSHTFNFNVVHGGLTMKPCTFRARTRIGTCYGPWRYFIAAFQGDPDAAWAEVHTSLVNCGRDVFVQLPPPGTLIYPFRYGGHHPSPCDSEAPPHVGPNDFLEGGYTESSVFLIKHQWTVAVRSQIGISFEDENGDVHTFVQYGAIFIDGGEAPGGGVGNVFLATHGPQLPEQFP
jgi:hypothetical protein